MRSPRHLLEVIHPTQRERFEVDARGLRSARIITRPVPQGARGGELVAVTRYEHDERGQLVASSLPDGNLAMHDQSNALRIGDPRTTPTVTRTVALPEGGTVESRETLVAEDRQVRGTVRGINRTTQRTMEFNNNSLTTANTHQFITYNPRTVGSYDGAIAHITGNNITGTVDMRRYMAWLRGNGYCFANDACDDLPTR